MSKQLFNEIDRLLREAGKLNSNRDYQGGINAAFSALGFLEGCHEVQQSQLAAAHSAGQASASAPEVPQWLCCGCRLCPEHAAQLRAAQRAVALSSPEALPSLPDITRDPKAKANPVEAAQGKDRNAHAKAIMDGVRYLAAHGFRTSLQWEGDTFAVSFEETEPTSKKTKATHSKARKGSQN